jgi:hypothetical protein
MWRKDEIFPGGPVSTRAGTLSVAFVHLPARRETGPPDRYADHVNVA